MNQSVASNYVELSDEDLLKHLSTAGDGLPRAAVGEIMRRGSRMVPGLVVLIDDESAWRDEGSDRSWAPIHATYLLAAMRPEGSLDAVVRAFLRAEDYGTEALFECSQDIFCAYACDQFPAVRALVGEEKRLGGLYEGEVLQALVLVARRRPEVVNDVRACLRQRLSSPEASPVVRDAAWWGLLELAGPEDRAFLESVAKAEGRSQVSIGNAFREGIPPYEPDDWLAFYNPEEKERRRQKLDETSEYDEGDDPIDPEVVEEMVGSRSTVDDLVEGSGDGPSVIERTMPKIGRNDPCPCGSGTKFKKCCGK